MTLHEALRALFEEYYLDEHIEMVRDEKTRSYDDVQAGAALICWRCCRRTVYATHPERGCGVCRGKP
jgi:hypothetical protein